MPEDPISGPVLAIYLLENGGLVHAGHPTSSRGTRRDSRATVSTGCCLREASKTSTARGFAFLACRALFMLASRVRCGEGRCLSP